MRFRIVSALDSSDYAPIVLEHALDLAARHDAPDLHFVRVVEAGDDPAAAAAELATFVLDGLDGYNCTDWRARFHIRTGRPHEEIVALAADLRANTIVIGRFGLHHAGRRLGSIASRVLDDATCPVLVVGFGVADPLPIETCLDCAAVREDSDGHRWFCAAHSAPDRVSLAAPLVSFATTGGGPLL